MPHITVTMFPGRNPEQKKALADKLQQALMSELNVPEDVVSVSVEDLPMEGWKDFYKEISDESLFIPLTDNPFL